MKKFLILLCFAFISIIVFYSKDRYSQEAILNSARTYVNGIISNNIADGDYNIFDGGIYNEYVSIPYSIDDNPSAGELYFIDNRISYGCLTFDDYKVIIENDEIIDKNSGKCEFVKLLSENEKLEEYVKDYLFLVSTVDITESGLYDISVLNEKLPFLNDVPSSGWVLLEYDELYGINILKYSIKYRNKVLSFIDEMVISDEVFDFNDIGENSYE